MMHEDEPGYLTELVGRIEVKLKNPRVDRTPAQRVMAEIGLTRARVLASGKPIAGDRGKVLQDMTDNFIEAGNIDMPSNP